MKNEPYRSPALGRDLAVQGSRDLFFQLVQAWCGRFQLFFEDFKPPGVGEITGPHQGDALFLRPYVKGFQVEIFCRGPGKARVYVKIRFKFHDVSIFVVGCPDLKGPAHRKKRTVMTRSKTINIASFVQGVSAI